MIIRHDIKFLRNTLDDSHKAVCTCGWFHLGPLQECQNRAAVHDIEWEPVVPPPLAPAVSP